jgi:hypothetical protein
MKKLLVVLGLVFSVFAFGCDDTGEDSEFDDEQQTEQIEIGGE